MFLAPNFIQVAALSKPVVPMGLVYLSIAAAISIVSVHAAEPIAARDAKIGDVRLHYLTAGKGPAVLLLHGMPRLRGCGVRSFQSWRTSSRSSRPILPALAIHRFRRTRST